MATITYTGTLVVTSCWCGVKLAIPNDLYNLAQRKGSAVFCPLGHQFVYGDGENKRLQEEAEKIKSHLVRTEARLDQARAEAAHQANRANGMKGALVQAKKRSAKGVCPVAGCKRHFVDVQRHVASKHPDYQGGEG